MVSLSVRSRRSVLCDPKVTIFLLMNSSEDFPLAEDPHIHAMQYQNLLRRLKTARESFAVISASFDEEIKRAHRKMRPRYLQNGVATLPDEILSEILEIVCDDLRGPPFKMLRVCQRFRRLIERMPRPWTRMRPDLTPGERDLALKLSRHHPLELIFVDWPKEGDIEFLNSVLEHAHRWKTCMFRSDSYDELPLVLHKHSLTLELPELRRLEISLEDPYVQSLDQDDFLRTWNAPQLSELHFFNYIPGPICGMSIVRCTIVLDKFHHDWDLTQLLALLSACPGMEELSVVMRSANSSAVVFPTTELTSLKSLEVVITLGDSDDGRIGIPLQEFMNALVVPNLTKLKVDLDTTDEAAFWYCITSLLPGRHKYDALDSLEITILSLLTDNHILDAMISHFPRLQHFSLEARRVRLDCTDVSRITNVPALSTVTLIQCSIMDPSFVHAFASAVQKKRRRVKLDSDVEFNLIGCRHLNDCTIRDMMNRGINVQCFDDPDEE